MVWPRDFPLPKFPDFLWGQPSLLINGYECCFHLDKVGGPGSRSPSSRAEVKTERSCISALNSDDSCKTSYARVIVALYLGCRMLRTVVRTVAVLAEVFCGLP